MNEKELTVLFQEFKTSHANLMALKPRIEISFNNTKQNSKTDDVPSPQIYVWHPFVFDNRLVPKEFHGLRVTNATISSTLPSSLNPSDDKPLWQVEDPKNYIKFVEDNSTLIRQELHSPFMTKLEMLDALTGGFERHVIDWYKMVSDWFKFANA